MRDEQVDHSNRRRGVRVDRREMKNNVVALAQYLCTCNRSCDKYIICVVEHIVVELDRYLISLAIHHTSIRVGAL